MKSDRRMDPKLQIIKDALKIALNVDFVVGIREDPTGYLADARREFAASADYETPGGYFVYCVGQGLNTEGYFFSYGKTEKAVVKDLAAQVEQFLRTRLDMCRTGLNTLLATEGRT